MHHRYPDTHSAELIENAQIVDPIKSCTEVSLHDPSLLPILQCTLQCMGHTQKCITGTQIFPISKLGGWKDTIAFHKSSKTNRHQELKHLRQYWRYGNWLVIGNRRGLWTFRNWGDIGLSLASRETTQTNKPPKHYTKTGGHNIRSSLKKKRKHTQWVNLYSDWHIIINIYEIDRKSRKWWHRIFFHLLDVALVNSYIIYKNLLNEDLPLKSFQILVVHWLAGDSGMTSKNMPLKRTSIEMSPSGSVAQRHKTKMPHEIRLSETQHLPLRFDKSQRRCNLCSTEKEPHRTWYQCSVCKVPLCTNKNGCFTKFHTNKLL